MHLARSPLSRRVDEVNTLRGLPPLLILTDRIAEVLKERHCVGMQALQRRRRGRSDDNDLKYTGCYKQTDKWKKNYYIKPPQQHQKTYKPEMLYPFDHGTIYYKGATSGPAPIPSFRAFPLYVYSAPLLSSRVSKRVNYLGC